MLINIDHIADLTGSTRRTVLKRLEDLQPTSGKGREKLYESRDALPLMFGMGKPSDKKSLEKERTRLAAIQAEKIELEVQVIRESLIPAEEVELALNNMIGAFRAKMLSLPARTAPTIVTYADAAEAESLLRGHIYEALTELSEYKSDESNRQSNQPISKTRRAPAPPNRKPVGGQQEETVAGGKRRTRPVEH
jgi:hypothetical protein